LDRAIYVVTGQKVSHLAAAGAHLSCPVSLNLSRRERPDLCPVAIDLAQLGPVTCGEESWMARHPTLMPDFPGSSAAQEWLVPVKVAQAEARPTSQSGPHAASRRTRYWADSELVLGGPIPRPHTAVVAAGDRGGPVRGGRHRGFRDAD